VLKPQSFSPNCAPKMRETYQLFFGLRLVSKEFHHAAIQTKIEQHFGGFFSSNESVPANRKTGFYVDRAGGWIHFCMKQLRTLNSYQIFKIKNKKLKTYSI
jgi:hypothetical protein